MSNQATMTSSRQTASSSEGFVTGSCSGTEDRRVHRNSKGLSVQPGIGKGLLVFSKVLKGVRWTAQSGSTWKFTWG